MNQLVVLTLVRHGVDNIEEKLLAEQLHPVLAGNLMKDVRVISKQSETMFYFREMPHDQVESIFLHVSRLASVRRLQDLQNILHRDVPLQVCLTEDLKHKHPVTVRCCLTLSHLEAVV